MGDRSGSPPSGGQEEKEKKQRRKGSRRLFRRKSLRSVGHFMHRMLKTLSTLSHFGESERAAELEDDDGGFKPAAAAAAPPGTEPPQPPPPPHEEPRLGSERSRAARERQAGGSGEKTPGVQGLKNHGNTCFMNAVLQCLSNTDLLAEFLGLEQYKGELARSGVNGVLLARGGEGEVTVQLAALVRALWTLDYTPQLSVEFKNVVSKHGSQFRGNSQHDALEFLLWLLDRVHEDLNSSPGQKPKTLAKPLPGPEESSGTTQVTPQPMGGHSFVQEHFQAQYRCSLTCPHCLKQSNTFDPFLCVSLPIPLRQTRALNVTLVFQSKHQRFLRIGLAVPLFGVVAILREMVANEGKIPPDQVILVEVYANGFQRSFSDDEDLNSIAESDSVYAFQTLAPVTKAGGGPPPRISGYPQSLPSSPYSSEPEGQRLPPMGALSSEFLPHGGLGKILILLCNTEGSGQQASRFGPPLLMREDRAISWEQLQQCILNKMRYLMRSEAQVQNMGISFRIRIAGGTVAGSYLSPQDGRPLYHPAVDRALQFSGLGGPAHVKLVVEWDPKTKECLFGNIQEEVVQDAESVGLQQQAHQQQHSCTLDECFQLYTKEEQLDPDDAWKCPHCKVLQQGMVKLSLWTLPDILIIHLKRFRQVGERRNKLSTLVKFPLTGLDMAPHVVKRAQSNKNMLSQWTSWKQPPYHPELCPPDVLYDLYAVCNHHGSMQGGHYTAYCHNSLDAHWYSYDDSNVELVLEEDIVTRGAYILFYQKRNTIPAWSASSSVRGSTSSSLSDHWLIRLSGTSKRGSLVSRCSANGPVLPKMPDSPVFTDSGPNGEKGGFESRPFVRGIQGRSVSLKASTGSKARPGLTKTMPLRWSFGSKERSQGASGELVEYLESGRRPRYTNESIIPLMTGAAGAESGPSVHEPMLTSTTTRKDQEARGTERTSGSLQGVTIVDLTEGRNNHQSATEKANTIKRNGKPKDDVPLQKRTSKSLLTKMVSPTKAEEPTRSKGDGSKLNSNGNVQSGKDKGLSGKSGDHDQRTSSKSGGSGKPRTSDPERHHEGKFTIFRSSFLKKDSRKSSESERHTAAEMPNGSSRTSLSNGTLSVISEGRANGMLPHQNKEDLTKGRISRSELNIQQSQSSSTIQSKAEWSLRRSASLHKNGGASHQQTGSVPVEKSSYGTLQRVKYHTASLGRKKLVPESSF
ncbi:ubiquitin carboxyl-terminal hydrolase 43 [Rhinatrema bivittatum]|uniref:ubiquitin carboxyl-terminal hydrolase 43 n=1 Tax=Rhinatrema bivittatum TaxID=194408 RepID=UPI0011298255|nr:ubiquitin carboxyl-terminal hydrolase 43 [Rhinatrema bivittatum]